MAPLCALPIDRVAFLLDSTAQLAAIYTPSTSSGMALATYVTRETLARVGSKRSNSVRMPQLVVPPHQPPDRPDMIVGVAALVWTAHHDTLTANILGVGVDAQHQRTGVAGDLIDALLTSAFEVAQLCAIRHHWRFTNIAAGLDIAAGGLTHSPRALYPISDGVAWSKLNFVLHEKGTCRRKPAGLRVLLRSGLKIEDRGVLLTQEDLRQPKYQAEGATVQLSVLPVAVNLLQPWLNPKAPPRDGHHFIPAHRITPTAQDGGNIAQRRGGTMGHTQ